jgi:hypothetical protein
LAERPADNPPEIKRQFCIKGSRPSWCERVSICRFQPSAYDEQVVLGVASLLALVWSSPAIAQKVTVVEELTASGALSQLTGPLAARPVAEAIGFATALEIATTPLVLASGNFHFTLDPATGVLVRTQTTFGPAFAERAETSGEGRCRRRQLYINQLQLSDLVDRMQPAYHRRVADGRADGSRQPGAEREDVVISGVVGVTQN